MKKRTLIASAVLIIAILTTALALYDTPQPEREIIAYVNNDPIYQDEFNAEWMTVAPEDRQHVTDAAILAFIIDKKLLLQAATAAGTELSDAQKKRALENINEHKQYNLTEEVYRERLLEEALINAFLNDEILTAFVAQSHEVRAYYEQVYAPHNISFEDAELRIITELANRKRTQEREAYITQLRERANVKVI